ncbi:MAG: hypothetical protein WA139_06005 [Candidatus Aenigmatarchaeota archaeon]
MTDSFLILTILGSIIGIYSILPEHKKLRVGYSFGKLEKICLLLLALAIVFLSIFDLFVSLHFENYSFSIMGFNVKMLFILEILQVISAIIILGIFLYKFFKKGTSIKNEEYFVEKVDELQYEQKYSSIFLLIEENYETILNSENKGGKIILDYLKRKLLEYEFTKHIVIFKPYLGLRIITDRRLEPYFKENFSEVYFDILLRNKNSILYKEVEGNQSLSHSRYRISQDNKILHTIFFDIKLAETLNVWKPIGEVVLDMLDEQHKKERDTYNEYQEKFTINSRELFNDTIFVGIRFFDIMILEAIYQKADYHMWLYYYSHFVDRICKNYKLNEYSQPKAEFPSPYSYMLYEITSNLRNWIKLIDEDTTDVQQELEHVDCMPENSNIIKSSIICLIQCNQKILNTDTIPDKFKEYLTHMILNLYFDIVLSSNKVSQEYGEILLCCILNGIHNYGKRDEIYKNRLLSYLDTLDKPPLFYKNDGFKKLGEIRNRIISG